MSERSEIDRMQRELGDEQSKLDALRSQHATSQESGSNLGRNVCFLGCGDEKTCFCWSNLEAGLVRRSRSKPDGGQSQSVCDNYPVSAVSDAAAGPSKTLRPLPLFARFFSGAYACGAAKAGACDAPLLF